MLIILTYDVKQCRVNKVRKICQKYLCRVQNSVFEGELTEAGVRRLKNELSFAVNADEDSVAIYKIPYFNNVAKEEIGIKLSKDLLIL